MQEAIFGQVELIAKLKELKRSSMQYLFTHSTKGEKTKITEIGEIPESWTVIELKSLVTNIEYGVSQAIPKTLPKHGYKVISTADIIKSGKLLYEQLRYIDVKDSQAEKLRLKNGDILFNWRNSLDHIGKSAIYDHNGEHVIFASFILRLRCDEKKVHNRFIRDLMNLYREQGIFFKLARRAVNQANYNRNEIYVLQIPAPTYDEQVAIADVVESISKRVEATRKKLSSYQSLFKTLLHELMSASRRVKFYDYETQILFTFHHYRRSCWYIFLNNKYNEFWIFITATATIFLWIAAYEELGSVNKTTKADFIKKFSDGYFNETARDMLMLFDYEAVMFVNTHEIEYFKDDTIIKRKSFPYFLVDKK